MANDTTFKIVVLGSRQVGKTALVVRFLTGRYISEYTSGKDAFYKKVVTLADNVSYNVEILDISQRTVKSGEELHEEHLNWGDCFLIVYSICDRESFEHALRCTQRVTALRSAPGGLCPTVHLAGNKSDLEDQRCVPYEEAHERAAKLGCHLSEISAAETYAEVSELFHGLLSSARAIKGRRSLPRHGNNRKLSIIGVSRVFGGIIFGRSKADDKKRRTSFSL